MLETSFRLELKNKNHLRGFIQKENYEPFLLNLLINTPYFSTKTIIIPNQSNSECDFYDPQSDKYYEATLLANKNIISNLIKDPSYLISKELNNEKNKLINIFNERIKSKMNKNASIILFNIFPDKFIKFQSSITDRLLHDEANLYVSEIAKKYSMELFEKDVILVSFNWDGSFFIRTLNSNKSDLYFINDYPKLGFPFTVVNSSTRII